MTEATVRMWGREIGAVVWDARRNLGVFQYMPDFARSGIEIAPLVMPLREAPYDFPALRRESFKGLPGLLADSLPDRFGNRLIDAWLARQGRGPETFNPVERLCYIGTRGMGALEFEPSASGRAETTEMIDVAALVVLANQVLDERLGLEGRLDDEKGLADILRVGTSAGGARAKALIAWNEETGQFRSGQVRAPQGFGYWLMKFDGVSGNRDKELADPLGFGRIEYAYFLMARAAGIAMMDCRLHEEGGRSHFMTRRFDRTAKGGRLHMQSLAALSHFDFNDAGAYSYEQAILAMRQIELGLPEIGQQVLRAIFNIMARNQDDHVKNIAFLMDQAGRWRLAPAFDVSYSYNPTGQWTARHQMSLNGRTDDFSRDDLVTFAEFAGLKKRRAVTLVETVRAALTDWPSFAAKAGVDEKTASRIGSSFRLL
jgi:serine/threonine-protein kinase HipA